MITFGQHNPPQHHVEYVERIRNKFKLPDGYRELVQGEPNLTVLYDRCSGKIVNFIKWGDWFDLTYQSPNGLEMSCATCWFGVKA